MTTFRLGLHLLAATVWVGGQLVLAGLVPTLRRIGGDAPHLVAQRFNLIAWPAYFHLLMTGVWSLLEVGDVDPALIALKFLAFIISGAGAAITSWPEAGRRWWPSVGPWRHWERLPPSSSASRSAECGVQRLDWDSSYSFWSSSTSSLVNAFTVERGTRPASATSG